MKQKVATFANFVCRFGKEKVLLDYLSQIVVPAFIDDDLIRSYGTTKYRLHGVRLREFPRRDGEPYFVIMGSFIKIAKLQRDQIFRPSVGIIQDKAEIESAPSAFLFLF